MYKIVVFFVCGIVFLQCNNKVSETDCEELNQKSSYYFSLYKNSFNDKYLDSAYYYTDQGAKICSEYQNLLSLRLLSIMSEQKRFLEAIQFIETIDTNMFSDYPFFRDVLIYRFKAMEATTVNDTIMRDKFLAKCVISVENYLNVDQTKVSHLIRQPKIDSILGDPLSTAIIQYYYYRSLSDYANTRNDLLKLKSEPNINTQFIDVLIDYLETDFMEFNGI